MALENFIPEVWAARLLENLRKSLVYAQIGIINKDYEGDIAAAGDTVRITAIGPVTVRDYTKNSNMSAPDTLADAQTVLTITQQKYFNFQIDDVDRAQQKPKVMDASMAEAAYALTDTADQYIAALYTDVDASNVRGSDGTPIAIDAVADAYDELVQMKVILDNAKIPSAGRWVIIPPWFEGVMLRDPRFVGFGTQANMQNLANGEIGTAAGFRVLKSHNVPVVSMTKYKLLCGYPGAITYAEQISKVEAYRPELRFADAIKGLHLYGAKVVRPSGIAVLTCTNSV